MMRWTVATHWIPTRGIRSADSCSTSRRLFKNMQHALRHSQDARSLRAGNFMAMIGSGRRSQKLSIFSNTPARPAKQLSRTLISREQERDNHKTQTKADVG